MPVLYAVIIGCFGYIGFAVSKQYDRKRLIFSDLLALCNALKSNLNYMMLSIKSVYINQARHSHKDVSACLDLLAEGERGALPLLTSEQNEEVQSFFSLLGKNDAQSQKQHIEFFENIFGEHLKTATLQCKEKGALYKKLCLLLGVLVCIILI